MTDFKEAIRAAAAETKQEIVINQMTKIDAEVLALPENMDWSKWSLPATAALLTKIPFRDKQGNPKYLSPAQAAVFAVVCYEYQVSPFTGDAYFMEETNRVNLTLQGKLKVARKQGWNLGAPRYEDVIRPWPNPKAAIAGYASEPGVKCSLLVHGETVSYTAWLGEWFMAKNQNWVNRTSHMLGIRAYEKAVSIAAGVGVSEMPDDRDIDSAVATEPIQIAVTQTEFVPPKKQ